MADRSNRLAFETRAIHGGQHPDPTTGAVTTPMQIGSDQAGPHGAANSRLTPGPGNLLYGQTVAVTPALARETALTGEQRGSVRDRSPAIRGMLGVERQMNADVVGRPVFVGGVASPWRRHHDRGACSDAGPDRLVHADVGGVARAEVITREDHEARIGRVTESFGERAHSADATGAADSVET